MGVKLLLHAGCGSKVNKPPRQYAACKEIRLDVNGLVEPDIVASVVAMPMVPNDKFDVVFCSHTLEHLFAHEVVMALLEFRRVLKPGGEVVLHVPDLQSIGSQLALDKADDTVYQTALGPITPLDMMYGLRGSIGAGNFFMAHKTGFTASVLKRALLVAGFEQIETNRDVKFELKATARKAEIANASQERSPEAVHLRCEGQGVCGGPPLRQQGQVAG